MAIRNKIKVVFFVEDGCSQDDDEASSHWQPINFSIYNPLFPELIQIAIDEWLMNNTIEKNMAYEVIFAHFMDLDGGGAVLGESFDPIHTEREEM